MVWLQVENNFTIDPALQKRKPKRRTEKQSLLGNMVSNVINQES
jgi:hypothetical protein